MNHDNWYEVDKRIREEHKMNEKEKEKEKELIRKKLNQILLLMWALNAILFTSLLFLGAYTSHIQHWTEQAITVMIWSSGSAKLVLSWVLLVRLFGVENK